MLALAHRLLAEPVGHCAREPQGQCLGERQSLATLQVGAHRLHIDLQAAQHFDHGGKRACAGAGEFAQREPLALPLPEAALLLGVQLVEQSGREARCAARCFEREQAAGRVALVRHARGAPAPGCRRLGEFSDLGLHGQRNVACNLRGDAG